MNSPLPSANITLIRKQEPIAVQMLTIKELSKRTGISEYHIRRLCKTNQIKHIRTGVKYLINYDRFIDYLNGK